MVIGVVTDFGLRFRFTTADDAAGAPIPRTRRFDGVLVVMTAGVLRQLPFTVAKNDAIFAKRKRPAAEDQAVGFLCR